MTAFGHDTWWLVLGKALAIFVFLMLNVLVAILLLARKRQEDSLREARQQTLLGRSGRSPSRLPRN